MDTNQPKSNAFISTGVQSTEGAEIEFSDGVHYVPGWMCTHLGGTDAVLQKAADFREITFADFSAAFHNLLSSSQLNLIQLAFVAGHPRKHQFPKNS